MNGDSSTDRSNRGVWTLAVTLSVVGIACQTLSVIGIIQADHGSNVDGAGSGGIGGLLYSLVYLGSLLVLVVPWGIALAELWRATDLRRGYAILFGVIIVAVGAGIAALVFID